MGDGLEQIPMVAASQPLLITSRSERSAWSVTIAPSVVVVNDPPVRSIVVAGVLFARYRVGQRTEERLALVRLVDTRLLTQQELAWRWGIARNTLGNWVRAYRSHGVEGLLEVPAAVRQTMAEELRQAAETVLREHPDASLRERNRLLAARGQGMLRERDWVGIRRALGIWGQLEFDLSGQPAVCATAVEPAAAAAPVVAIPAEMVEVRAVEAVSEPVVVEAVPAGARSSRYAGLALLLPAMAQLLAPILARLHQPRKGRWRWGLDGWVQAIVLYLLAGHLNPEQTKLAGRREMGWLIGRYALPSCQTLRRLLPRLAEVDRPRWIPLELARQYLRLGWVELGGWFIDGHFVPYHGQAELTKAWWPQRRLAVRGHHQYWVNDQRGRPLVAFLAHGFEVFAHTLPTVAQSLRDLLHSVGEAAVPVIVFDRGGYSARLFHALDAMGIGWITWRKGEVSLPAEAFTAQGKLETQHRPPQPCWYAEHRMRVNGYRDDVLAVAWHAGEVDKQVALLSNLDRLAPGRYQPLAMIQLLEARWSQENYFQTSERRQDIGWLDGYPIEPMDETAQVPNPARRRVEDKLLRAEHTRERWRRKMDTVHERFDRRRQPISWERFLAHNGNSRIFNRYMATCDACLQLDQQRQRLPERVPYATVHEHERDVIRLERGAVVVALRAAAYHIRQQLLDDAVPVFLDYRERAKFVDTLLHGGGWWLQRDDGIHVILHAPEIPRYYRAAVALLTRWNRHPAAGIAHISLEKQPRFHPLLPNADLPSVALSTEP